MGEAFNFGGERLDSNGQKDGDSNNDKTSHGAPDEEGKQG